MIDEVRRALDEGRDLDARLLLAAHVTALAAGVGLRPVLVSGSAVDFYTAQTLESVEAALPLRLRASMDLDFVALDARDDASGRALRAVLSSNGFRASGGLPPEAARVWTHPRLPIPVEVMTGELYGSTEHIHRLEVDGHTLHLWGPEDVYWHYLEAAHATRHRHDYTRAQAMLLTHGDTFDWPYLEGLADLAGLRSAMEASRAFGAFEEFRAS